MSDAHAVWRQTLSAPRLSPQVQREHLIAAQRGDAAAREALIEANLRLVASIARRFVAPGREFDDLFQVGCIGLAKAVDRFDPTYDVQFSTYAVPLILGEIRQHLRQEGPVHVSRRLQQTARQLQALVGELQQELGRSPTPAELAARSGLDEDVVTTALDALRPAASFDEVVEDGAGEGQNLHARIGDATPWWDSSLDRLAIAQVLAKLSPRERLLLRLRFLERRSQTEAATALGVSQPQCSRLERQLLAKLRELLTL